MNATKRKAPAKAQNSKQGTVKFTVVSPLAILAMLGEAWASGYVAALAESKPRRSKKAVASKC
jgi:hypothetical protein